MKNGAKVAISPHEVDVGCGVGWTCFEYGTWEPHVEKAIRANLLPGQNALDIGANIGYFAAVMAQVVGNNGRICAFEPVPSTVEQLRMTVTSNGFNHVEIMPIAVGAAESTTTIWYDKVVSANASMYKRITTVSGESAQVPVLTIDSLYHAGKIPKADFIKIDVEGHELSAFTGAKRFLIESRPTIVFEYNPETAALAGWQLSELVGLLSSCCGYAYYIIVGDGHYIDLDPVGVSIRDGGYIDILAVPHR
jgi:FkbM family methyltransferase